MMNSPWAFANTLFMNTVKSRKLQMRFSSADTLHRMLQTSSSTLRRYTWRVRKATLSTQAGISTSATAWASTTPKDGNLHGDIASQAAYLIVIRDGNETCAFEDDPALQTYYTFWQKVQWTYFKAQHRLHSHPAFIVSGFLAQNQTCGFLLRIGQYTIGVAIMSHLTLRITGFSDFFHFILLVKTLLHCMRGTAYTFGGVYGPSALAHSPSKDIKGCRKRQGSDGKRDFLILIFPPRFFRAKATNSFPLSRLRYHWRTRMIPWIIYFFFAWPTLHVLGLHNMAWLACTWKGDVCYDSWVSDEWAMNGMKWAVSRTPGLAIYGQDK